MSTRPSEPQGQLDPLSDVIELLRLSTQVHGHFEQKPPFAMSFAPSANIDVHLMTILRGTAAVATKGVKPLMLSAGDLFLHVSREPLELRDAPNSRAEVRVVPSCPTVAQRPFRKNDTGLPVSFVGVGFLMAPHAKSSLLVQLPPLLVIGPDSSPTLAAASALFRAEATTPQGGSRALLSRLAEVIFIDVLRRHGERKGGACGDLKAFSDPPLARAIALIHAQPEAEWTIESLGRAAGLSRSAFAARFHEKVGEPPLHYIARWRMTRAAKLLAESDAGIGDVALEVGYRSEASFSRAFTRHMGLAPGAFRRRERTPLRPT